MDQFREDVKTRAQEYKHKAQQALKFKWFKSKQEKYEEAQEFFSKAAAQFKITKDWKQAAECYDLASLYCKMCDNSYDAQNYLLECAKCHKMNENVPAAIQVLQIYLSNNADGNTRKLANASVELAELEEQQNDMKKAIQYYKSAVEFFTLDNSSASANKILGKVADIYVLSEDYKNAEETYEILIEKSESIGKYSIPEYILKLLLCHWLYHSPTLSETLQEYEDLYPIFTNSSEGRFFVTILKDYNSGDVEQFTQDCNEYHRNNNVLKTLLQKVKAIIGHEDLAQFNNDVHNELADFV